MTKHDFPQAGALISLKQAKEERRCRVCGDSINVPKGPQGRTEEFGAVDFPIAVTLNFGEEFAHTICLQGVAP